MQNQDNKATQDPRHSSPAGPARSRAAWPRQGAVLGAALLLSACTLGPDFKTPGLPAAAQGADYTASPMPGRTAQAPVPGGQSQQLLPGRDIPAQWWAVFRSEPLDRLIRDALAQSPTLASAQATLREAQANYEAQSGSLLWPQVNGSLGGTRERASQVTTQVPMPGGKKRPNADR